MLGFFGDRMMADALTFRSQPKPDTGGGKKCSCRYTFSQTSGRAESIATKLAMPIKFESRRKKVQRFLSDDEWDLDDIWLSLVIGWIQGSVNQNNVIYRNYSG